MNESPETLREEVDRLKLALADAQTDHAHFADQHLTVCAKTDQFSRILSALLVKENGEVFVPEYCFDSEMANRSFSLHVASGGYILTFDSIDQ